MTIIFSAFFSVLGFIIAIANINYFIPFIIISLAEGLLFIAGLYMLRDKQNYGSFAQSPYVKKRYFLALGSFGLYLVGISVWAIVSHALVLILPTFLTIIPILMLTINYFNIVFEEGTINKEKINASSQLDVEKDFLSIYKVMFFIPVMLDVISAIIILIFPWYSTSANILNQEAYNSCTAVNCDPLDYIYRTTLFYGRVNLGLSRFMMYFVLLFAIVSGIIIFLSFKEVLEKRVRTMLKLGMYISTLSSFALLSGLAILYYYLVDTSANGFPHILYYSFEPGLLIGSALILLSTAVAFNINRTIYNLIHN